MRKGWGKYNKIHIVFMSFPTILIVFERTIPLTPIGAHTCQAFVKQPPINNMVGGEGGVGNNLVLVRSFNRSGA